MKYLKCFEEFNLSDDDRKWLLDNAEGFNTKKDAENELNWLIKYKYDDMNGTIELYRVIFAESEEDIDTDNLGEHWTDEEIDNDHIDKIRETGDYKGKPYIVTATFNKSDINLMSTLHNNMTYPTEFEVTMDKETKPLDFSIELFN